MNSFLNRCRSDVFDNDLYSTRYSSLPLSSYRSRLSYREHRLQAKSIMRPMEVRELSHQWLELKTQRGVAPRSAYAKHAFVHPFNVLLLATVLVVGLATIPWMLPFALLGIELTFLCSASCIPSLRQRLDKELLESQRRDTEDVRQRLLNRMNDDHRAELEHLELLVDSIRSREADPMRTSLVLDDHLGLDRLTARYAELAVIYRETKRRLALTDCESIDAHIRTLERTASSVRPAKTKSASKHVFALQEQRKRIAYKRRECYERNLDRLDEIRRELSTIAELVRLLHEQSVTSSGLGNNLDFDDEVERFITDFEGFYLGMGELAAEEEADSDDDTEDDGIPFESEGEADKTRPVIHFGGAPMFPS